MSKLRVLVANEPRSYREVLSAAFEELRTKVEVLTVEPEALERMLNRSTPGLVLCSKINPAIEQGALAWVELYPGGEPLASISIDGLRLKVVRDIGLTNLLWIVDQMERLSQGSQENGSSTQGGIQASDR